MWKLATMSLASLLALAGIAAAPAQGKRTVIGILPVYDNSAEPLTENLPTNLTYMIYRDLLTNPAYEPVLLSPGGLYDPDAADWITGYAAKAKVDVVLISSILPSIRVNDRHRRLKLEVTALNVATGKLSSKGLDDTVEVANSDLFSSIAATYVSSTYAGFFRGPQDFENQPLGKAAGKLVEWTRSYVDSALPGLEPSPTGAEPLPKQPACDMDFRIRYVTKKAASKAYTLLANDKDETTAIQEGVAHFSIAGGPLVLRIQVKDAPYGIQTEKLYQLSTVHDCSATSHTLVMEMGGAGEAFLNWQ